MPEEEKKDMNSSNAGEKVEKESGEASGVKEEKKTEKKTEKKEEKKEEKTAVEASAVQELEKENARLKAALAKEKDDYVRQMADFENFRRHSAEAKLELVTTAAADTIKGLLPVLDDCERAMKMLEESSDDVA